MSIQQIPKIKELCVTAPIYTWEHFWFTPVDDSLFHQAEELATSISRTYSSRKTQYLSERSDAIGKLGGFLARQFCEHFLSCPWSSNVESVQPQGGDRFDLLLGPGLQVDVKTRQLHGDLTIAPNFDLRVPETELHRFQHLYFLAGYCPETAFGYLFGWATWEELQSQPIRQDIRVPAKSLPLIELHPMQMLEEYLLTQG